MIKCEWKVNGVECSQVHKDGEEGHLFFMPKETTSTDMNVEWFNVWWGNID